MLRFVSLFAAAATLVAPQIAQAATAAQSAPAPCLTTREFTALSTYALPSVIGGTTRACAPVLPADGYLRNHGAELVQRYGVNKAKVWPEARAALLKMSAAGSPDTADLFSAMPDDSLQQVADAAMAGIVSGKVKPGSCATIDRMVALLAPLPAENTAELIAVLAGLGSKTDQARIGKIALCKV